MMKKTVAVFFGGKSAEHDVSIVTAIASVIKPLRVTGEYQVEPVYIARSGAWYWGEELADIELYTSGHIDTYITTHDAATLSFDGGLTLVKTGKLGRKQQVRIDVAFPALHGTYGEDGSLMGLLRMAGVPFVGCDMEASVIAMDKALAKQVADMSNIPTPRYEDFFTNGLFAKQPDEVIAYIDRKLNYPMFVKPAHLGSSIGITRVADKHALYDAIDLAAHYDDRVIVEEAVSNLIEVTVPIIGNTELKVGLVERPLKHDGEFFDFDTKYMNGGKKTGSQGYSELPAKLQGDLYELSIQTAKAVYWAFGCSGIARIDLLIDGRTGVVYFNEINPLPGSLYMHNWQASGVTPLELTQKLVKLAEERAAEQSSRTTSFSTNYLKQF